MSSEVKHTPDGIDSSKIDVAVRFLNNPNVYYTDKTRKIEFLKSKGLSDEEIEFALNKANVEHHKEDDKQDNGWSYSDYFKGFVLSAGILSAANYAYKAYFLPYIAHEMKDDRRIENLNETVQVLKDDLKQSTYELNGTLKHIQGLLEEQQKLLVSSSMKNEASSLTGLSDLKTELATIKSMMLSKRQFPPAPFTSQGTTEIPAWQQVTSKTEVEESEEVKTA
ncbi:peroxisomal membrane protein PEX14-like [Hydractinia symbiolongicarpus]|uniref:peroxisomal membrane protein PEX14-like n=1 Tax=Hydractinia symbiolongicarpus TaxID=13093 RepID=UPI00254A9A25|nr:peroxisomal membrane protein PEX14-like [Hydractinia symbiolongicarpus]